MNILRSPLDASCFQYAALTAENEFVSILQGFIRLYQLIRKSGSQFDNSEVTIRDAFSKYLKDVKFTNAIEPFMFYRVNSEVDENDGLGRLDLKIERLMPYTDPRAYFSIECKRIDGKNPKGKSGLNAKYVKYGINRYTQGKYTAYHGLNGMFGFVVTAINIEKNVTWINGFLNRAEHLKKVRIDDHFEESYLSSHKTISGKKLLLYHLMFDFHDHILGATTYAQVDVYEN